MDLGLGDQVAVVTGGSRGIGRAVASAFASGGANLVLGARDAGDLQTAAEAISREHGVEVLTVPGDLGQPDAPAALIEAAIGRFDRVDALVNVAGDARPGTIEELSDDDWDGAFGLKFMGTVRATRAVLPTMRAQGTGVIINIAGVAGRQPGPRTLTTGAVNAALCNLARGLVRDLADDGIRINTVVPGPTATDRFLFLVRRVAERKGISEEEELAARLTEIADGRPGRPEEVADAVVFLASPRAGHITGAVLDVEGGQLRGVH